jgi:competence protein ComEA
MQSRFVLIQPTSLLVVALAVFLGLLLSREVSPKETFPAFLSKSEKNFYVELVFADESGGVYQINDGSTLCDVIKLTGTDAALNSSDCRIPLVNGERIFLQKKAHRVKVVEKGWMAAGQRVALSIPLHPDRMKGHDWLFLPGIGERLAERIQQDRQINGEFGGLKRLTRVKGIGQKRVMSWQKFF